MTYILFNQNNFEKHNNNNIINNNYRNGNYDCKSQELNLEPLACSEIHYL